MSEGVLGDVVLWERVPACSKSKAYTGWHRASPATINRTAAQHCARSSVKALQCKCSSTALYYSSSINEKRPRSRILVSRRKTSLLCGYSILYSSANFPTIYYTNTGTIVFLQCATVCSTCSAVQPGSTGSHSSTAIQPRPAHLAHLVL